MTDILDCGHPAACLKTDDYEDSWCEWCCEVDEYRRQVAALTNYLEQKAVIVNGGIAEIDGPVGYLVLNEGSVYLGAMTCTAVDIDGAF